jgi:ubiquinone/menaquinone biosynthesis C-methylase UbiE
MANTSEDGQTESPYDILYRTIGQSPTLRDIYQETYGSEYPAIANQTSFVTRSELAVIAKGLQLREGTRLVDLGCGSGGPGLWLARKSGVALVGVDRSRVAIGVATRHAVDCAMDDRAAYRVADLADTGLPDASFEGAVSMDALQVLPDPRRGVKEAARLLVPGARLAFTTWETQPPATAPEHMRQRFVSDYRPVLEACGFGVVHHAVPDGWLELQLTISRRILEQEDALTRELGDAACALLCAEAREDPQWLQATRARRVVVVAEVNS